MLYLDPHTTQVSGDIREREIDASYHIPHPGRISISGLDPSLALCFLCITEQEFDNLCINIQVGESLKNVKHCANHKLYNRLSLNLPWVI